MVGHPIKNILIVLICICSFFQKQKGANVITNPINAGTKRNSLAVINSEEVTDAAMDVMDVVMDAAMDVTLVAEVVMETMDVVEVVIVVVDVAMDAMDVVVVVGKESVQNHQRKT